MVNRCQGIIHKAGPRCGKKCMATAPYEYEGKFYCHLHHQSTEEVQDVDQESTCTVTARCEGIVHKNAPLEGRRCVITAKYEHEGKMYCKIHHPPSREERNVEWRAFCSMRWAEKVAQQTEERKRYRINSIAHDLCVKWMMENHPDICFDILMRVEASAPATIGDPVW